MSGDGHHFASPVKELLKTQSQKLCIDRERISAGDPSTCHPTLELRGVVRRFVQFLEG